MLILECAIMRLYSTQCAFFNNQFNMWLCDVINMNVYWSLCFTNTFVSTVFFNWLELTDMFF